jgi:mRNA-degrading endonuclease toxin of MazEF toxin-antitoxin module
LWHNAIRSHYPAAYRGADDAYVIAADHWTQRLGEDRPVLVLTRDPVADRIPGGRRGGIDPDSTWAGFWTELTVDQEDHVPSDCVVNFANTHTLPRNTFVGKSPDDRRRAFMRRAARYEPAPDAANRAILVTGR